MNLQNTEIAQVQTPVDKVLYATDFICFRVVHSCIEIFLIISRQSGNFHLNRWFVLYREGLLKYYASGPKHQSTRSSQPSQEVGRIFIHALICVLLRQAKQKLDYAELSKQPKLCVWPCVCTCMCVSRQSSQSACMCSGFGRATSGPWESAARYVWPSSRH